MSHRGNLLDTQAASAMQPLQQAENRLIDTIFGMNASDLDNHFNSYLTKQDNFFSKMNITNEDFAKVPNLAKKRILINMTNM